MVTSTVSKIGNQMSSIDPFRQAVYFVGFFLLYTTGYVTLSTLGRVGPAGWFNLVVQFFLHGLIAATALCLLMRTRGPAGLSYAMLAAGGIFGMVVDVVYNYLVNIGQIDTNANFISTLFYHLPWSLFLISWIVTLASFLKTALDEHAVQPTVAIVTSAALALGYTLIFGIYYSPILTAPHFSELSRAFHLIFAIFEAGAFVLGLIALLFSRGVSAFLLVTGFMLLLTHEVVFQMEEISAIKRPLDCLEISWSMALAIMLLGLLQGFKGSVIERPVTSMHDSITLSNIRIRSLFAGIPVAAGVVVIAVFMVGVYTAPDRIVTMERLRYPLFVSNLFLIAVTCGVVVFESKLERALRQYQANAARLWDEGGAFSIVPFRILKHFGLDASLKHLAEECDHFRSESILLGCDRVFFKLPSVKTLGGRPLCFVLMPFTPPWSARIFGEIRQIASESGFECLRADGIFGRNVIEDVWAGISSSEVLIADLTGRSANVLYEVGIGHALGKPMILLAQSSEDIPFDLAHRRVIVYSLDEADREPFGNRIRAMLQDIKEATSVRAAHHRMRRVAY